MSVLQSALKLTRLLLSALCICSFQFSCDVVAERFLFLFVTSLKLNFFKFSCRASFLFIELALLGLQVVIIIYKCTGTDYQIHIGFAFKFREAILQQL